MGARTACQWVRARSILRTAVHGNPVHRDRVDRGVGNVTGAQIGAIILALLSLGMLADYWWRQR